MPRRLEFFFDYVSPYSYLANSQIAALVDATGAEIAYRPFLLGGVMQSTGNSPPGAVPARAKYMPADIERWLRRYDLEFNFNPHFPMKTITALRGALAADEQGDFAPYHAAMFRAAWVDQVNLGDPAALQDVIQKAGLDARHLLARAENDEVKERLKSNTAEAVARGAFGAPTFFVGDELFFGNDRLDFVAEALRA